LLTNQGGSTIGCVYQRRFGPGSGSRSSSASVARDRQGFTALKVRLLAELGAAVHDSLIDTSRASLIANLARVSVTTIDELTG
jgi:hypothetical protein